MPHLCIISAALSWPFFLASQPGPHERSFESLAPSTWYFLKHAHHYPSPVWISTLFLMVAPEPYHINHTALQVVLTFMVFTAAWLSPSPLNLLISSGLPSLSFPTMAFPKHHTQDSSHLTLSPCPQTLRKWYCLWEKSVTSSLIFYNFLSPHHFSCTSVTPLWGLFHCFHIFLLETIPW